MGDKLRAFLNEDPNIEHKKAREREIASLRDQRGGDAEAGDKTALHKFFVSSERAVERRVVSSSNPLLEEARLLDEERKRKAQKVQAAAQAEAKRSRKLLVCGDARGGYDKMFQIAAMQDKKVGPFDALLCVGSFLPVAGDCMSEVDAAYLRGDIPAPRPVYFIDTGSVLLQAAPGGRAFGANVNFLGSYGVREICGLRIAFLSGRYDPGVYGSLDVDYIGGAFTAKAVDSLKRLAVQDGSLRGIDVLLTAGWPEGVDQSIEDPTLQPPQVANVEPWQVACAPPIAELCLALEPRYHIFGSANVFYQRPPFQTSRGGHACRCIGLGKVGSPLSKQQKWIHALALSPMAHMAAEDLTLVPPGSTACPFSGRAKKELPGPEAAKQGGIVAEVVDSTETLEKAISSLLAGNNQQYWDVAEKLKSSPMVSASVAPASSGGACQ